MAIVKADHKLEQVSFVFDDAGEVKYGILTVNYAIKADENWLEETRIRKSVSIWGNLPPTQKTEAGSWGKNLNTLAKKI